MSRVRVEPVAVPLTPRLEREAAAWRRGEHRPRRVVQPGPGQESVWDYPRPPALQRVLEPVTVTALGELIVDTRRALRVCETASPPTYYVPIADVRPGVLRDATGRSQCEWKGVATYLDVAIGERVAERAAWTYREPLVEYALLADMIAFYAGRVDRCTVGGVAVRPQPGAFYGGWITPDLVGPFKGDSASRGW